MSGSNRVDLHDEDVRSTAPRTGAAPAHKRSRSERDEPRAKDAWRGLNCFGVAGATVTAGSPARCAPFFPWWETAPHGSPSANPTHTVDRLDGDRASSTPMRGAPRSRRGSCMRSAFGGRAARSSRAPSLRRRSARSCTSPRISIRRAAPRTISRSSPRTPQASSPCRKRPSFSPRPRRARTPTSTRSARARCSGSRRSSPSATALRSDFGRPGDGARPPRAWSARGALLERNRPGSSRRTPWTSRRPSSACRRAATLRSPVVEDPGAFAVRGGLLDVWPPARRAGARRAVRRPRPFYASSIRSRSERRSCSDAASSPPRKRSSRPKSWSVLERSCARSRTP